MLFRTLCFYISVLQHSSGVKAIETIWLPGASGSGPYNVIESWTAAFTGKYPEARITLNSIGSGATQQALIGNIDCQKKSIDAICEQDEVESTIWGIGDAPLSSTIRNADPASQIKTLPSCAGAVAIVFAKDVTSFNGNTVNMTMDVVSGVFNATVQFWDDPALQRLNPSIKLPHEPIAHVVRKDSSGQTSIFTGALGYNVPSWPEDAIGKKPNWPLGKLLHPSETRRECSVDNETVRLSFEADGKEGVALGMLRVPFSVGYMEIGFASGLTDFLGHVALIGNNGIEEYFSEPNEKTIRLTMDGLAHKLDNETLELELAASEMPVGGYPLSGYGYWYIKTSENAFESCYQAWLLCKLIEWAYIDPQATELALSHGWIVPPDSVVQKALTQLRDVKCVDTESGVATVISAMDYTPEPYRVKRASNTFLTTSLILAGALVLSSFLVLQIEKQRRDTVWKIKKKEVVFIEPLKILGTGSFGQVCLAEFRGTHVAVKRIYDATTACLNILMDAGASNSVVRVSRKLLVAEMKVLAKLRHPSIASVMGIVLETRGEPMIVMEYLDRGALYNVLHDGLMLDAQQTLNVIQDIALGVRFIHSSENPVVHKDIKAKNILLDKTFRAKIGDFGLSSFTRGKACGTPFWMAPELLRGDTTNSFASDIYALGVVMFEIYSRKDPYNTEEPTRTILQKVIDPTISLRPHVPFRMPPVIETLMKECLQSNPNLRPTAEEVDNRLKRVAPGKLGPGVKGNTTTSKVSMFENFPDEVYQALKAGQRIASETRECVTVASIDIDKFHSLTVGLEPLKVTKLLESFYAMCQHLSQTHDVFTPTYVGDAYIVVANLVKDQTGDHTRRVTSFVIDVVRAAKLIPIDVDRPELGNLKVRVGIHSGPVEADIVGDQNPRYGVMGKTVDWTARLENASGPCRILCCQKTQSLLRKQMPEIPLIPRGCITAKGIGNLMAYWVNEGDGTKEAEKDTMLQRIPQSPRKGTRKSLREQSYHSPRRNVNFGTKCSAELVASPVKFATHSDDSREYGPDPPRLDSPRRRRASVDQAIENHSRIRENQTVSSSSSPNSPRKKPPTVEAATTTQSTSDLKRTLTSKPNHQSSPVRRRSSDRSRSQQESPYRGESTVDDRYTGTSSVHTEMRSSTNTATSASTTTNSNDNESLEFSNGDHHDDPMIALKAAQQHVLRMLSGSSHDDDDDNKSGQP